MNYDFALNKLKLNQVIAKCGANATEEEIKAEYLKRGGLVEEESKTTQEVPVSPKKEIAKKKVVKKVAKKTK